MREKKRRRMRLFVCVSMLCLWSIATGAQSDSEAVDTRPQFPPSAAHAGNHAVPNLASLRSGRATPPIPGGVGAGTLYRQGALPATNRAELSTQMIVHPTGIDVPDWIFTTATNRTEKTVEVVGIYIGPDASLGVFDWSCSVEDPCPSGSIVPDWQWTRDLTELPCYYAMGDDGGGHQHNLLSYVNSSKRRGNEPGPSARRGNWRNDVFLLNRCTRRWDLVYRHDFATSQRDCSLDSACGWWGPIVETFNVSPQPLIKELGFLESALRYDHGVSRLTPTETDFSPPNTPWLQFHRDPNRSWGIGSSTAN
jgi:hypothetical protein